MLSRVYQLVTSYQHKVGAEEALSRKVHHSRVVLLDCTLIRTRRRTGGHNRCHYSG
ncbi:hypothetical protein ACQEV4_08525 [Streptomyces shenzhenensis]|uniref:hypothetical protein n=1 Tax=Streptomyces shenzhenensis TaxID=943815 RepID=UPI003D902560